MDTQSKFILLGLAALLMVPLYGDPLSVSAQESAQEAETSVAGVLATARAAGVSETVLSRMLALSGDFHLSAADTTNLIEALCTARLQDLPLEPFLNKIEEGLSKRVAVAIILDALERMLDNFRFVRTVMETKTPAGSESAISPQGLILLTDGLNGGLSREDFADFIRRAPPASVSMVAVAVENLALLDQIGFDRQLAERMLFTGLRVNHLNSSWRYLAKVIAAARERGLSESHITRLTITAIEKKRSIRELMADLGFTTRDLQRGPVENHTSASPTGPALPQP
jgi:hypothetical protein